jgi:hypothetical protein
MPSDDIPKLMLWAVIEPAIWDTSSIVLCASGRWRTSARTERCEDLQPPLDYLTLTEKENAWNTAEVEPRKRPGRRKRVIHLTQTGFDLEGLRVQWCRRVR